MTLLRMVLLCVYTITNSSFNKSLHLIKSTIFFMKYVSKLTFLLSVDSCRYYLSFAVSHKKETNMTLPEFDLKERYTRNTRERDSFLFAKTMGR